MKNDPFWERIFGEPQKPSVPVTFNKNTPLMMPHYTDERFKQGALTLFGREEKGLHYNYSDRLWQWDYDKAEQSGKVATASGAPHNSAAWYEAYLSAYFDTPVEVRHILGGVNASNGYAYFVFGYRYKE